MWDERPKNADKIPLKIMLMSKSKETARTVRVEALVARLASFPLMRESVFHSPKFLDVKIEKEICDILLVHRNEAIVIQVKAQEKPRDNDATYKWVAKQFLRAASQVVGAQRTLLEHSAWCQHESFGRVELPAGTLKPRHSLVLLECEVEALVESAESATRLRGSHVPFSVMSIKDFLYLLHYLRTWRDLAKYLDARSACLRPPDSRTIGNELALLSYYTAMRDSFRDCTGIADARLVSARGEHVASDSAFREKERNLASILESLMENMSTMTATTLPDELERIESWSIPFEQGQAEIRDELCNLTIQERAALGEQIGQLSKRLMEDKLAAALYGAVRFSRQPERLYMVIVGAEADHESLGMQAMDLTIAGCIYYSKSIGITLLLNQSGDTLRFSLARFENVQWDAEMAAAGQEYFSQVRPRSVSLAR